MTKHFDIPREKIRNSEMEYLATEPLKDGDTTLARELITGLMAFAAAFVWAGVFVLIAIK